MTTDHKIQFRHVFASSAVGNSFSFAGTSIGLTVVGAGTAELQHSNLPDIEGSWETLATQAGDGTAAASTERAFGRVVMTGAGAVAVSCAGAKTGAGGGGGGGDASQASQNTQITAANLANARLGAVDEAAAASDGASSGLNGLLRRLLGRWPTLGAKAGSGSVSFVPATDALLTVRQATTATLVNASAGASLTALASGACRMVFVNNNRPGAVDLEWDFGSGGTEIIAAGSYRMIDGISNANQIRLRRADGVATTVTVSTELRS